MRDLHRRREALGLAVGGVVTASLGVAFWDDLLSAGHAPARTARPGRHGPLGAPNALGLRVPRGFQARLIARGGEPVAGTGYRWHRESDGAAVFPAGDGHVLVANAERDEDGGASAIRFDASGAITGAYRVLEGTRRNCSGGGTPWGTWLSCEEVDDGRVWECDPAGRRSAVARPALGVFKHEAAALDPRRRHVYLTEDREDGCLYRFSPTRWGNLAAGRLEVATVRDGRARWTPVPDPAARRRPTRDQVPGATRFARAEGIWFDAGVVYIATTQDSRIYAYDTRTHRLRRRYDARRAANGVLTRVDALAVSPRGKLLVCEDNDTRRLDVCVVDRAGRATRVLSAVGARHHRHDSELTGLAFSPDGRRMYVASQRAAGVGEVYAVTGPVTS